jgi:hypothetical protein
MRLKTYHARVGGVEEDKCPLKESKDKKCYRLLIMTPLAYPPLLIALVINK